MVPVLVPFSKTIKYGSLSASSGRPNEGALGDLVSELHETIGREFEGGRADRDLVHESLARALVANVDGVAAVVVPRKGFRDREPRKPIRHSQYSPHCISHRTA